MKRLLITIATIGTISCGGLEQESALHVSDAPTETFKLSSEAGRQLRACEVYTKLKIESGSELKIHLSNDYYTAPNANCPDVDINLDKRVYIAESETTRCGSVIYKGKAGNDSITVTDHRKLICRSAVPATIVVEESRRNRLKKLYSYAQSLESTEEKQMILSCVETQTFRDVPGNAYRVAMSGQNAFVLSKPVRMRGGEEKPWVVESPTAEVRKTPEGDLKISEKSAPIDWTKEGLCYKLVRSTGFSLQKSGNAYNGLVTQGGYIAVDPNKEGDCIFPSIRPAPANKVQCQLY